MADPGPAQAAAATAAIATLIDVIDSGELEASDVERAYLAGAAAVLEEVSTCAP